MLAAELGRAHSYDDLPRILHGQPPLDFSCETSGEYSAMWVDLRRWVNNFAAHATYLPEQVMQNMKHSRYFHRYSQSEWSWKQFDMHRQCFPGMLVLRLLTLEYDTAGDADVYRGFNSKALVSELPDTISQLAVPQREHNRSKGKERGVLPVQDRWLLLSHMLVIGPAGRLIAPAFFGDLQASELAKTSWFQLGFLQWSLFQILRRLTKAFWRHLTPREVQRMKLLVPHCLRGLWHDGDGLFASAVQALSGGLSMEAAEVALAPQLRDAKATVDGVQASLQAWLERVRTLGGRDLAFAAFLLLEHEHSLFAALDRMFLSDTVLLQLPAAFHYFGQPRALLKGVASDWQVANCRHAFRHGIGLHHRPKLATALVAAGHKAGRAQASGWGCALAIRLLRSRASWMSDVSRGRGELHCSFSFLYRMKKFGEANTAKQPVLIVEVGASLGDCMLAAAALIPDGQLRAYAFEADRPSAAVLAETLQLNGLDVVAENRSWVQVRQALLSNESGHAVPISRSHIGIKLIREAQSIGNTPHVLTQTLDDALADNVEGVIDIMHIFANSADLLVVQGAARLLKAQRVRCLIATMSNKTLMTMEVQPQVEAFGYKLCDLGANESNIVAIPASTEVDELCCPTDMLWTP
eukprot:TRINITY_DN84262_c0_g1_i1.p1 TRINITY_DN84262_c0_g1~~TRINITY_DN84262_c0_g1_i1.p1  ORF type:complete len:638 (-),score=63.47 TRINITY_DN84262_c0_g1_i1:45-1958(-)